MEVLDHLRQETQVLLRQVDWVAVERVRIKVIAPSPLVRRAPIKVVVAVVVVVVAVV